MPDEVTNGLQRAQKPHKTGVWATLWKVQRGRKQARNADGGKKQGGKGEEKGKSHAERRERKRRDSETFEEMVGRKQVQKSNSGLQTSQELEGTNTTKSHLDWW